MLSPVSNPCCHNNWFQCVIIIHIAAKLQIEYKTVVEKFLCQRIISLRWKKNCAKIRIWRGDVSLNLIYIHKLLLVIMCFFVIQLSQTNTKNIRQIYCALKLVSRMCRHWTPNVKKVLETSKYILIFSSLFPYPSLFPKKKLFLLYHPPNYFLVLLSPEPMQNLMLVIFPN